MHVKELIVQLASRTNIGCFPNILSLPNVIKLVFSPFMANFFSILRFAAELLLIYCSLPMNIGDDKIKM